MADPNASGKVNRFVGICIQRGGHGLGATFVLRNIIDNQGEVYYFLCYFWSNKDVLIVTQFVTVTIDNLVEEHGWAWLSKTVISIMFFSRIRCGDLLRAVQPPYPADWSAEAGEEAGWQPDVPERCSARVLHCGPGHEAWAHLPHRRGACQQGERALRWRLTKLKKKKKKKFKLNIFSFIYSSMKVN